MLREPQKAEQPVQLKKDKHTGRFQIVKLEERIAPHHSRYHFGGKHGNSQNCHYNPQGKLVGCG